MESKKVFFFRGSPSLDSCFWKTSAALLDIGHVKIDVSLSLSEIYHAKARFVCFHCFFG